MEQNKKTNQRVKIVAVKKSNKALTGETNILTPAISLSIKIIIGIIFLVIIVTGLLLATKQSRKETSSKANQTNKISQQTEPGKVIDSDLLEEGIPESAEVITQGRFKNVEQIVEGKALFIESKGARYLRFENFKVVNGQDIHVYLSPISNLDENDVVDLGVLKSTSGNFNYPIDKKVDLAKYNNVLIWSNPFKAFFGYASLLDKELPLEPQKTPENQVPEENNEEIKIDKENPQMPPVISEENETFESEETTSTVTDVPVTN